MLSCIGSVRLGVASKKNMRAMGASACFISSIDFFLKTLPRRLKCQFSHISAWRKYWLIDVNSALRASLSAAMTFGLPFILRSLTARAASRRGIISGMRKIWLGLLAWCAFASYDPAIFSSLTWRSIGPARGGRSIASAGSSSRPLGYYFGATGGGLWKTTDGGLTWRPVTDGQLKSSSVGAVAVSESNPDVVYIGMGETELRGNIMQGDGVYKSADAGKTWKHMGLSDTQAISRIRVHPANPDVVYVSALGHPYGPNPERGVFRSKDGGQTWTKVLFRNDRSGAVDLCLDPKNPNVLFAAIWDAYRTPWSLSSGGPSSGLFKSTDGGDHWTE